jgi:hypothetical protein
MTELLDKAFAEASKLPSRQQDEVAAWILGKLAAEWHPEKRAAQAAGRVAEGAVGYHGPVQDLSVGEAELKGLFKEALLELLQEHGDLVRELVTQIVEDTAMVRAIDEGAATRPVSKAEVWRALEATR